MQNKQKCYFVSTKKMDYEGNMLMKKFAPLTTGIQIPT